MAVIVIHAGMPKAGSSSVQHWLQANAPRLREQGFTVLTAPESDAEEVVFAPYEGSGSVNCGWIVERSWRGPRVGQRRAEAFAAAIAAAAERHSDVVISGESLSFPFFEGHAPTLAGLQWLSAAHRIRVAYYARPQHTSLEATWRQAGFRTKLSPSVHVERRAAFLHYAATREAVRSAAPGLDFEPRPFRPDMLDDGDVVADFAGRFLGVEAGERVWENRGLPLEVVNVLRAAPSGMVWDKSYGNLRVKKIKRLLDGHSIPEAERIALSRQVLRKYAHERFAAENAELGWEDFVPPPHDPEGTPGLEALDDLWRPQASPAELSLIFRALQTTI